VKKQYPHSMMETLPFFKHGHNAIPQRYPTHNFGVLLGYQSLGSRTAILGDGR